MVREAAAPLTDLTHLPLEAAKVGYQPPGFWSPQRALLTQVFTPLLAEADTPEMKNIQPESFKVRSVTASSWSLVWKGPGRPHRDASGSQRSSQGLCQDTMCCLAPCLLGAIRDLCERILL